MAVIGSRNRLSGLSGDNSQETAAHELPIPLKDASNNPGTRMRAAFEVVIPIRRRTEAAPITASVPEITQDKEKASCQNFSAKPHVSPIRLSVDENGFATVIPEPTSNSVPDDLSSETSNYKTSELSQFHNGDRHADDTLGFYETENTTVPSDEPQIGYISEEDDFCIDYYLDPTYPFGDKVVLGPERDQVRQVEQMQACSSLPPQNLEQGAEFETSKPSSASEWHLVHNDGAEHYTRGNGFVHLPAFIDYRAQQRYLEVISVHQSQNSQAPTLDPREVFKIPPDKVKNRSGQTTIHRGLEHLYPQFRCGLDMAAYEKAIMDAADCSMDDYDSEYTIDSFTIEKRPARPFLLKQSDESKRCEALLLGHRKPLDDPIDAEYQKFCVDAVPPHARPLHKIQDIAYGELEQAILRKSSARLEINFEKPAILQSIPLGNLETLNFRGFFGMNREEYKELELGVATAFAAEAQLHRYTMKRKDSKKRFCRRLADKLNEILSERVIDILSKEGQKELNSWFLFILGKNYGESHSKLGGHSSSKVSK